MTALNTILIVEDDRMTREMLRQAISCDNYVILEASKGQRALDILEQYPVDLILLDLILPDMQEGNLVTQVRAKTKCPVFVISGIDDETTKIDMIQKGADDFMEKPINAELLNAKIMARIRRQNTSQDNQDTSKQLLNNGPTPIKFEQWTFDEQKFQLYDSQQQSAGLTFKEFQILKTLVNNSDQTISRHDLCKTIQEDNYIPSDRAIDVKITRIRKKIGDDAANPHIIKTIRGAGYMFCATITSDQ